MFLLGHAIIDLASCTRYVASLRAEIDRELALASFAGWTMETVARLASWTPYANKERNRSREPEGSQ